MIRICSERDGRCPHGMDCPFSIDRYSCDMEKSREALKAPGKPMTDISESGIEAALRAGDFSVDSKTKAKMRRMLKAYLPFHPPSREEGLREAAKAITDLAEEWKRHDGTLPRIDGEWPAYMAKVVLRLIPTKPEAKEDYSDTIAWLRDDAERRTEGIVGNEGRLKPEQTHQWRAAEALSRISATLQSKKPE